MEMKWFNQWVYGVNVPRCSGCSYQQTNRFRIFTCVFFLVCTCRYVSGVCDWLDPADEANGNSPSEHERLIQAIRYTHIGITSRELIIFIH